MEIVIVVVVPDDFDKEDERRLNDVIHDRIDDVGYDVSEIYKYKEI